MGRINQLPASATLNSTDVIAVDAGTGGTTNKMTGANLAGQLKALGNYQDKLTFDSTPTAGSTNPVTSGGVKTALDGKQNTLTFDTTPTAGSTNPVTSGGIATAISQSTANFTHQASTIAELNAVISGLSSATRTTVFLANTVVNELVGQSASGTALMTKMDANTADMIIYSLGGNYIGAVRYSIATSSVSKELPAYQRYSDVQITTGDSQYQGYYYGDITLSNISDDRIRSVVVYGVTSNRPAFAIRIGASAYRVFTTVAATVITLRVFYV